MIVFPGVMSNPGTRRNGSSIKIRLTGKKTTPKESAYGACFNRSSNVSPTHRCCKVFIPPNLTRPREVPLGLWALLFAQTSGFCVANTASTSASLLAEMLTKLPRGQSRSCALSCGFHTLRHSASWLLTGHLKHRLLKASFRNFINR